MIRTSITLTELVKIITEQVKPEVSEHVCEIVEIEGQDPDYIFCRILDIDFAIIPSNSGPFHESFVLSRLTTPLLDPELICTEFNSFTTFANAKPVTVQTEDGDDDSDEVVIEIAKYVILKGGVTDEHIAETLNLWVDMLVLSKYRIEGVEWKPTKSGD